MSIDPQVPDLTRHTILSNVMLPRAAQPTSGDRRHARSSLRHWESFGLALNELGPLDRIGRTAGFTGGTAIYGEQDPVDYLYRLDSGMARAFNMRIDGRRQIVAFYVPGDLFGFECGDNHTHTVEVVTTSRVRIMKWTTVKSIAVQDESVALRIRLGLGRELHRDREHILQLGNDALERVAAFLLNMSERLPNNGTIKLPMARQDIADYLCLTIETVSRCLTQLKGMATITLTSARDITIQNPGLLKRLVLHDG